MESIFSWARRAKCRNEGLFQENLTKKYCTDCPVISLCSTYAIIHEERGVWGGMGEADRSRVPPFIKDNLIKAYQKEGLLENRDFSSLLAKPVEELLPEQMDPNDELDPYLDPMLDQSA